LFEWTQISGEVVFMKQNTAQSQSEQAWTLLNNAIGNYFGTGLNHDKLKYEANCHLKSEIPQKLISIAAQAKGMKGEIFHDEISWVGRDILGSLSLFVNSNNHPGITPHYFNRLEESKDGSKKIIFRYGDPDDKFSFREEVTFTIFRNYNIEHTYAWGLPGGTFETRSSAMMKKII
jgi:hypothetical protein